MRFTTLKSWLKSSPAAKKTRLALESLEARENPAGQIIHFTWDGGGDGVHWNDPNNWDTNTKPVVAADDAAHVHMGGNLTTIQDIANLRVSLISFEGGGSNIVLDEPTKLDGNVFGFQVFQNLNGTNKISGAGGFELIGSSARVKVNAGTVILDTPLSGAVGLTQFSDLGAGTLELRGDASYQGDTTVVAGTLLLNGSGNDTLPATTLVVGDGAFPLATVKLMGINQIADGATVSVKSDGTFDVNAKIDAISGLDLDGGKVRFTDGGLLSLGGGVQSAGNSSILRDATDGGALNLFTGNHTFNVTGGDLKIDAVISGTGKLVKTGGGALTFDHPSAAPNNYSGGTEVKHGGLILHHLGFDNATGTGPLTIGDGAGAAGSAFVKLTASHVIGNDTVVTIKSDGQLQVNGLTEAVGGIQLDGGSVELAGGELILNGNLGGNGKILAAGGGKLTLPAGDHTFAVGPGDVLDIQSRIAGAGGVTVTGGGEVQYHATAANANSYTGLTWVKHGTLALHNGAFNKAFGGNLKIGDGLVGNATVRLDAAQEIPDAAAVTIESDGQFDMNGKNDKIGSLVMAGGADVVNGGVLELGGNVMVSGGSGKATIAAEVNLGAATRTFTVGQTAAGTDLLIDGVISGGASAGLVKDGTGQLEFKGSLPNAYGGATFVNDGILNLNKVPGANAVPNNLVIGSTTGATPSVRYAAPHQLPITSTVWAAGDGTLDLNGFNDTIGGLILGSTDKAGTVKTGGGKLTLDGDVSTIADAAESTISGNLDLGGATRTFTTASGSLLVVDAVVSNGGIEKQGPGYLHLAGDNTYSGPTTLNEGTLGIAGNQPDSPVAVNAGRFFPSGVVGTITGTGGEINPGSRNVATAHSKDLVLGAATLDLSLTTPSDYDRLVVAGGVDLTGGSLEVNRSFLFAPAARPVVGERFTIVENDAADAVVGTFNGYPEGHTFILDGRVFRITYQGGDGNDVVLQDMGVLPSDYAAGADAGGAPQANVYNPDGTPKATLSAFEDGFAGGVRTAIADVTGDGVADLIAGSGPGRVAEVRIYDGATNQLVRSVQPFGDFTGGVFVAAGDFDNDGRADVVVTPDLSGGPRVTVLSGADGSVLANFFGIDDANFRGGARAAIADVDADGKADLIVSAGFGGGPRIAVFDGESLGGTPTRLMPDFFAFEQSLRNGAYVAAGDLNGDAHADLIFGGGPGGGPRVLALNGHDMMGGTQTVLANFFAGNPDNRGGVRLAAKNLDGDTMADLVVGDGEKAGSHVTAYLGKNVSAQGTPAVQTEFDAFAGFLGGVFVG